MSNRKWSGAPALVTAALLSGAAALALAGCGGADNHQPPNPQLTAQQIQNNPHMPPQAKAAALAALQAHNTPPKSNGSSQPITQ